MDNSKFQMQSLCPFSHFSYDSAYPLGNGGSGTVFLGIDSSNKEKVAIKIMDKRALKSSIQMLLMEQEISILTQLQHEKLSSVIQCREIVSFQDKVGLVFNFYEGGDLGKVIKKGKINKRKVKVLLKSIIEGYLELAKRQIVHRDLKPDNLLLASDESLLISDMGFAIKQNEQTKKYPYIVGSPGYMAPEALEQGKYGVKSDIWAIGVITYAMLEGKTPWKGKNSKDLLKKIKNVSIQSFLSQQTHDQCLNSFMRRALTVDLKARMGLNELYSYLDKLSASYLQFNQGKKEEIIRSFDQSLIDLQMGPLEASPKIERPVSFDFWSKDREKKQRSSGRKKIRIGKLELPPSKVVKNLTEKSTDHEEIQNYSIKNLLGNIDLIKK